MFLQKILPNIKTQKSYLKVFESGSDIVRGIWCGITKIDPVPVSSGQSVEVIVKMATEKSMKVLPQQFNSIFLHLLKVLLMDGIVQPAENPVKYLMLDAPSPPFTLVCVVSPVVRHVAEGDPGHPVRRAHTGPIMVAVDAAALPRHPVLGHKPVAIVDTLQKL